MRTIFDRVQFLTASYPYARTLHGCAPCRPGQVGEELSIQGDAFWGWAPLPQFLEVKVTAAESRA